MEVKEHPGITTLKDTLSEQAQSLVLQQLPSKIEELNKMMESDLFIMTDATGLHSNTGIPTHSWNGQVDEVDSAVLKKRKLEDSKIELQFPHQIPCNKKILEIMEAVKPEIVGVIDRCNKLKIWVQLMIPKIEDGNNFGVGIQEDVLGEVTKAESDAGAYLEQMSRYFSTRAKLVSKVIKYPQLDDYRQAVKEYDEKVFVGIKVMLRELRNIYVVLYDVIIKNFEKLIRPRNSNTSSLY